ncbi:serine/threonine protein kinase [Nannizzia gypsea CBS 118893]|uniref:Serine/threonine protein kinase n=1 Tax=Arthroderma gypseum (strain ATCC MYA-4604 / CBS 118893) TaxID=535722 RepID=E4UQX7_ARTGP|nr:serine/threonine protein kinase [Nannizzia gypsea CBS 118893]EFQ99303.1 serine/threonine protein kinase [Nannizzia gypsea CBS 118893]
MLPIRRTIRMRSRPYSYRPSLALNWKHALYPGLPRQLTATPVLTLTQHGSTLATKHDHNLFKYTFGRYLYNEHLRLAERYVEFNVNALKDAAARAVGRDSTASITKLAEGGFNRVFLLTMNDGFEVIVKIPYLLAVPQKLTTESEVATLDFLRGNGIPVPKVYAWSSDRDNKVGTEYIIMEKASGKPLADRWFDITPKEMLKLVTSYVDIEKKLFSLPFAAHGSLYYKDSLPQSLRSDIYAPGQPGDDRFCIGPITDYMFWRGRRASFDLNRGPWRDHCQYLQSIGQRELEWTQKYGNPMMNDFPHNSLEGIPREISHTVYIDLLRKYLLLAPYILPQDPTDPMNKPTLRHPDLNPSNIFVSEEGEITCIIDWQYTTVLPLLLMAGNPPMFDNPDSEPPKDLKQPSLPPDYDTLSAEEKEYADELHRRRMLFWLYMVFNGRDNKPHLAALRYPLLMQRQHLADRAGRPWSGDFITLKGAILRIVFNWGIILGNRAGTIKCPVQFSKKEEEEFYAIEEQWFQFNILTEHLRSRLDNLSEDGWVRNGSYNKVVAMNKEFKEEWLARGEDDDDQFLVEKGWPFQDHEEVD